MIIKISSGANILFTGSMSVDDVNTIVSYSRGKMNNTKDVAGVIETVAAYFGLQKVDIMGRSRIIEYIQARSIIYYYLVHQKGYSLTEVGKLFKKTHATIINGVKRAERDFKNAYKNIFGEEII